MQLQTIVVTLFVLFFVIVIATKAGRINKNKNTLPALSDLTNLTKRSPLTNREREMFLALSSALPEYVVLAQVALSALLTTNSRPTRNRFDRKVADFVICSKQLAVVTVIELDDSSHDNKKEKDADRDAMLKNAGYHTIRYKNVPDSQTIRDAISELLLKTSGLAAVK